MKTTIQIPKDKGLVDGFPNADEVSKDHLFVTVRRADLEESKWWISKILFITMFWKIKQHQK